MAWTTTKKAQFANGNHYVQLWEITTDSATCELSTGLGVVDSAIMSPSSMNSGNSKYVINALSGATASNGYVSITGCTSGDRLYLTVYGH